MRTAFPPHLHQRGTLGKHLTACPALGLRFWGKSAGAIGLGSGPGVTHCGSSLRVRRFLRFSGTLVTSVPDGAAHGFPPHPPGDSLLVEESPTSRLWFRPRLHLLRPARKPRNAARRAARSGMHTECRVRFRDAASAADRGAAGARCRQRNPSCLAGVPAAGTCGKAAARARRGGGAALTDSAMAAWPAMWRGV